MILLQINTILLLRGDTMHTGFYENHVYKDTNFPIIFHEIDLSRGHKEFTMHWHENIELLYFIEGKGAVTCDILQLEAGAGDIVVVNSNNLHDVQSVTPNCRYYCLIVDKFFCDSFDLLVGDICFVELINDKLIREYFDIIIQEMLSLKAYYKVSVKSSILRILIHLCRHYSVDNTAMIHLKGGKKLDMVKAAISHIRKHYKEELSIDEICSNIGFSKYYCCHIFKEITGRTIVDYINFLRCSYAHKQLSLGTRNVSEIMEMSGFKNLSYFSKVYKKHMGKCPSKEQVKH